MARLGESRTSSLSGLNATPSTATRLPASEPPAVWRASATTRSRRPRLIASTVPSRLTSELTPSSAAVARNARMSLGRQPPP